MKANRLTDAETVQRKILHIMESSKVFFSLIFNMFIVSVFTKKVLFNDVVAIIKKIIY